jgi:hypothetical protein
MDGWMVEVEVEVVVAAVVVVVVVVMMMMSMAKLLQLPSTHLTMMLWERKPAAILLNL